MHVGILCSACRVHFEFLALVRRHSFLVQRLPVYMLTWNSEHLRIGLLLQAALVFAHGQFLTLVHSCRQRLRLHIENSQRLCINLVGFSAYTQHLRGTSRIPAPRCAARVSA